MPVVSSITGAIKNNPTFLAHPTSGLLAYSSTDLKPFSVQRLCILTEPLSVRKARRKNSAYSAFSHSAPAGRQFCRLAIWSLRGEAKMGYFTQHPHHHPVTMVEGDFSVDDRGAVGTGNWTDTMSYSNLCHNLKRQVLYPHFSNAEIEA